MIGAYPSNIMKCHLYAEKNKKKTHLKYFRLRQRYYSFMLFSMRFMNNKPNLLK